MGKAPPVWQDVETLAKQIDLVSAGTVDRALLERALTHRSYAYEQGGLPHSERQEFLGDAVLEFIVTEKLFNDHEESPEGVLARYRSGCVNTRALAAVGRNMHLGDYIRLGKGELNTGGRDKDSILADTVEAVIAAVFQSGGIVAARRFISHVLGDTIASIGKVGAALDWKTSLQEYTSSQGRGLPTYTSEHTGPPHAPKFTAFVHVDGQTWGSGQAGNKKTAEALAAEEAWHKMHPAETTSGKGK